jgi:SAM-dependent methyltransferase
VFTDRTSLQTCGYADHGPLAARLSIYDYQVDRVDLVGLAVTALADVHGAVLDAGCGLGNYTARLRAERPDLSVHALDLSSGMGPEVVGDVQALPVRTAAVDAALAMHMLYHVPDIPAAVRELRRVVRPGGVLLASTNGLADKQELGQLLSAALTDLTGSPQQWPAADDRFSLDDRPLLEASFEDVTVDVFERETVVPAAEPVVAFVDSFEGLSRSSLPAGVDWPALMTRIEDRVCDEVARTGAWRMANQIGLFTCR